MTGRAYTFLSTPSARRAPRRSASTIALKLFLSTPSARRATKELEKHTYIKTNFYPRPLRGGRHAPTGTPDRLPDDFYPRPLRGGRRQPPRIRGSRSRISIHALCEEGDPVVECRHTRGAKFLSTPSARRATANRMEAGQHRKISIHALCEEGDLPYRCLLTRRPYFYPRPLRGGRPEQMTLGSAT